MRVLVLLLVPLLAGCTADPDVRLEVTSIEDRGSSHQFGQVTIQCEEGKLFLLLTIEVTNEPARTLRIDDDRWRIDVDGSLHRAYVDQVSNEVAGGGSTEVKIGGCAAQAWDEVVLFQDAEAAHVMARASIYR